MSHRLSFFAASLLMSGSILDAADPAPAKPAAAAQPDAAATPAPVAAKPEPVAPYELKNRSKFGEFEPSSRAPFWPIGWVKRKPGAVAVSPTAVAAPKVMLDEKAFRVTSILIGSGTTPSLAVINGRAYSEGEFLRMPKGGSTPPIRIRVQRINDGTVILQNADQTMVASLARPELLSRPSNDTLLDPDR